MWFQIHWHDEITRDLSTFIRPLHHTRTIPVQWIHKRNPFHALYTYHSSWPIPIDFLVIFFIRAIFVVVQRDASRQQKQEFNTEMVLVKEETNIISDDNIYTTVRSMECVIFCKTDVVLWHDSLTHDLVENTAIDSLRPVMVEHTYTTHIVRTQVVRPIIPLHF